MLGENESTAASPASGVGGGAALRKAMHILVLGAGGFIGSHLTERLVSDGMHHVVAVDIADDKLREAGVLDGGNAKLEYHRLNILTEGHLLEAQIERADVVVDLIAVANPAVYVSSPLEVFHLNFTENLRIVEWCVKHEKRIVQFSTCEVYGMTVASVLGKDPREMPMAFAEDSTPLIMGPVKNQRWIYACGKQLLERVLHAYGMEKDLKYSIIRPFNFVGPRIDYLPSEQEGNPRVFSHFMNALLYGTPMQLVDGGTNLRGYTYIDDAIECCTRVIEDRAGNCDKQIFNVGKPDNELSIRDMAFMLKDMFEKHFKEEGDPETVIQDVSAEEFYGKGYEDCDRRIADITKAKTLLGWEPKIGIRDTFYRTMEAHVKAFRAKANAAAGSKP